MELNHQLSQLLSGELAPYRHSWQAGQHADSLPLSTLTDGSRLDEALAIMEQRYPGAPRRAQVSQWTKYYLRLLIPMALATAVTGHAALLKPQHVSLRLDAEGFPVALESDHPFSQPAPETPLAQRYQSLLTEHLPSLFGQLARYGNLSQRVLWNSAGNLIEHLLQRWQKAGVAVTEHSNWLLGQRRREDGTTNLLWQPVRYVESFLPEVPSPVRLRRQCCLRYELAGEVCCATCPLLPKKSEKELHALLQHWHAAKS